MKVLIDTNILLDVIEERENLVDASKYILDMCLSNNLDGAISTLSIANIVYCLRKDFPKEMYNNVIIRLGYFLKFLDLKSNYIFDAIDLDFADYEDALQTATAMSFNADYIITRNKKDFKKSPIKVVTPEEMLTILSA